MTEEQRAQQEERLNDVWNKMPVEAKARLMRLNRALNQMPPEERQFIHDRIERFVNMSPEEKQRLKENAERWKNMSPEERQKARDVFRQRRLEFEQKWRAEHPGEEANFRSGPLILATFPPKPAIFAKFRESPSAT